MANGRSNALKSAAEKVARYVDDVATITIETRFVDLSDRSLDFDKTMVAARTELRMDGDCTTILPARSNPDQPGQFIVDADLFDVHQRVVATAIEYRARMLGSLLQVFLPQGAAQAVTPIVAGVPSNSQG